MTQPCSSDRAWRTRPTAPCRYYCSGLVGQGRVSEVLDSSDDSLRVDQFFCRLNWSGNTRSPLEKLNPSSEPCWMRIARE